MSVSEEKNVVRVAEEGDYVFSKETDKQFKEGAEQLAEIIKNSQKAERIRKIIELELSGKIGVATRSSLLSGLRVNVDRTVTVVLIMACIERSEFVDKLAKLDISEDVLTFLKDLNLLYQRRAQLAYNYAIRREDWVDSNFEVTTTGDKELKISMELIKGNGEIVHIEGYPNSFLNLIGTISNLLSDLDLADILVDESLQKFEKDIDTLIDVLKGKTSEDSE